MTTYTSRPPHRLAGLFHEDEEARRRTLAWVQRLWEGLEAAELEAHRVEFVSEFLKDLLWPRSVLAREWLCSIAECAFENAPEDTRRELMDLFRSQGTSMYNERLFQQLVSDQRLSNQSNINQRTRWMKSITSRELADNDRKQMPISPSSRLHGVELKMQESYFEAKRNDFSLGDRKLKSVGNHPDVPNQAIVAYNMVGMRTEAMLQMVENLPALSLSWLSLLLTPGLLVWHRDGGPVPEQLRYVVGTTSTGAVVAHVRPYVLAGRKWVEILPQGRVRVAQQVVCNASGWFCSETVAVPPMCGPARAQAAVHIEAKEARMTVLQHNAWQAFPEMNLTHLHMLLKHLEIPCGRKPTLMEAIKLLARSILGDVSDADLAAICKRREARASQRYKYESHLDAAGEYVLDGVHPDDVEDLEEELRSIKEHSGRGGSGSGGAAKAKAEPKKKKAIALPDDVIDADLLKPYLPKILGCRISLEATWHHRYKATYPRDYPPYSTGCSFGGTSGVAPLEAAKFCLRWAWEEHTRSTGVACPFDL